jgi:hypothetical protein
MTSPDTITGEIEFRNGDDTTFEPRRRSSKSFSAAC